MSISPLQADLNTINVLLPVVVGALATIVTAYLSFRVQRGQLQAQMQAQMQSSATAAQSAAREADKQSWEHLTELMKIQKESSDELRNELDEVRKELDEEKRERRRAAAAWNKEREELEANVEKMSKELAGSYREINELRTQVNTFTARIRDLEAENTRLKGGNSGTANPRSKL